eukprot:7742679-Pyramimonas_sp.AAC.1
MSADSRPLAALNLERPRWDCRRVHTTRKLRNRGIPHTYIMAGVVIANMKHVENDVGGRCPADTVGVATHDEGWRGETPRQPHFASPKKIATAPPRHLL